MITARVTGIPILTIDGSGNYTALVPVSAYDDDLTVVLQTSLIVTGNIGEGAALAGNFLSRLRAAATTWKATVAIYNTCMVKLAGVVGMVL